MLVSRQYDVPEHRRSSHEARRYSPDQLLAEVAAGEDPNLRLQEVVFSGNALKTPNRNDLADEIAAFANGKGGRLVLGVQDGTREILGIPFQRLDCVCGEVTEVCRDAIDPPVNTVVERLTLPDTSGDSRWVLLVEVPRSLLVHEGPSGYCVRVSGAVRQLTPDQLLRLFRARHRSRFLQFDQTAVPATRIADLDPALVDRFRPRQTLDDLEGLAIKLGMAVTDSRGATNATVAGILLGTSKPEQWLPHASIQAVAYRDPKSDGAGDTPGYQIDAEEIGGPLDQQVADACQFVARNQQSYARNSKGIAFRPKYEMQAILEAMVNAVAHRDYSLHQCRIRMRMFPDRLEIFSPGALVNTMTIASLEYRQATRNSVITRLLTRCTVPKGIPGMESSRSSIIERRGGGECQLS